MYKEGALQLALMVKNLPANAGDIRDMSSIPGSQRSPGGRHSNPPQYSYLENPMDRGAWRAHKELDTNETTQGAHTYRRKYHCFCYS